MATVVMVTPYRKSLQNFLYVGGRGILLTLMTVVGCKKCQKKKKDVEKKIENANIKSEMYSSSQS